MHVFITGATGFIGRAVALRLQRDGHRLSCWVRSPSRARTWLGPHANLVPGAPEVTPQFLRTVADADAVINLAGESIVRGRWNPRRKRELVDSRIDVTRKLVNALAGASGRPKTLVSASAVGYYGLSAETTVDEHAGPGVDFLATLCNSWEAEAARAEPLGTRVVTLRLGMVLAGHGGALARLLPLYRAGLGGRIGSGNQPLAWIHLSDVVELIATAISDEALIGPVNAVAPERATHSDLAFALGRAIGRPPRFPVPAFAVRLALGDAADVLLRGIHVTPGRLLERGFEFQCPTLHDALDEIVDGATPTIGPARAIPASSYLRERGATHELIQATYVDAPLEQVFDLVSNPRNLGMLSPRSMELTVLPLDFSVPTQGDSFEYTIKLGPISSRWLASIASWEWGVEFTDILVRGPFRGWWHEHRFTPRGDRTVLDERVLFSPRRGPRGLLVHGLSASAALQALFRYRRHALELRFGSVGSEVLRAPPEHGSRGAA